MQSGKDTSQSIGLKKVVQINISVLKSYMVLQQLKYGVLNNDTE
jgi:hypothetical protein